MKQSNFEIIGNIDEKFIIEASTFHENKISKKKSLSKRIIITAASLIIITGLSVILMPFIVHLNKDGAKAYICIESMTFNGAVYEIIDNKLFKEQPELLKPYKIDDLINLSDQVIGMKIGETNEYNKMYGCDHWYCNFETRREEPDDNFIMDVFSVFNSKTNEVVIVKDNNNIYHYATLSQNQILTAEKLFEIYNINESTDIETINYIKNDILIYTDKNIENISDKNKIKDIINIFNSDNELTINVSNIYEYSDDWIDMCLKNADDKRLPFKLSLKRKCIYVYGRFYTIDEKSIIYFA